MIDIVDEQGNLIAQISDEIAYRLMQIGLETVLKEALEKKQHEEWSGETDTSTTSD